VERFLNLLRFGDEEMKSAPKSLLIIKVRKKADSERRRTQINTYMRCVSPALAKRKEVMKEEEKIQGGAKSEAGVI
jgi:hypothetical protein